MNEENLKIVPNLYEAPTNTDEVKCYYNITEDKYYGYDGTQWVEAEQKESYDIPDLYTIKYRNYSPDILCIPSGLTSTEGNVTLTTGEQGMMTLNSSEKISVTFPGIKIPGIKVSDIEKNFLFRVYTKNKSQSIGLGIWYYNKQGEKKYLMPISSQTSHSSLFTIEGETEDDLYLSISFAGDNPLENVTFQLYATEGQKEWGYFTEEVPFTVEQFSDFYSTKSRLSTIGINNEVEVYSGWLTKEDTVPAIRISSKANYYEPFNVEKLGKIYVLTLKDGVYNYEQCGVLYPKVIFNKQIAEHIYQNREELREMFFLDDWYGNRQIVHRLRDGKYALWLKDGWGKTERVISDENGNVVIPSYAPTSRDYNFVDWEISGMSERFYPGDTVNIPNDIMAQSTWTDPYDLPESLLEIVGEVRYPREHVHYYFTPTVTGTYAFGVSDAVGTSLYNNIGVWNGGVKLGEDNGYYGFCFTCDLEAGRRYIIECSSASSWGETGEFNFYISTPITITIKDSINTDRTYLQEVIGANTPYRLYNDYGDSWQTGTSYQVTFDMNGATEYENITKIAREEEILDGNGFNTQSDGLGTQYGFQNYTFAEDTTLYATFDRSFETYIVTPYSWESPTREGYELVGWSEDPNATEETYGIGSRVDVIGNITLYAVWAKESTFLVSYKTVGSDTWSEPDTYIGEAALKSGMSNYKSLGKIDLKIEEVNE